MPKSVRRLDTTPYWNTGVPIPRQAPLDRPLTCDVVVVGGGIAGITTAYLLQREGRRVVIVERDRVGSVDSGHTSAHLTCATDTLLSQLVDQLGPDHARAVWDAGLAAMSQIATNVEREAIDCNLCWVPGYLHVPTGKTPDDADVDRMKREASVAAELGFDAGFLEVVPFVDRPGVAYASQARFQPRQYLRGLLTAFLRAGGQLFERTSADEVRDDPLSVVANGFHIECSHVVIATHNPIAGLAGTVSATLLQTTLQLYTTYVVAARVARGRVPDALFWDTDDPYRYLRVDRRRGFDIVLLGGEDHKTGQSADTEAVYERLAAALRAIVRDADITHRWSGQVIETTDGLPMMGWTAPHQFVATGFAGNGMTFGTLGGMMARDAILGDKNPWSDLLDIHRNKVRSHVWDYLKENADYPYYMMRDRFAGAEGKSIRALAPGQGAVVEVKGHKVAAYREINGALILRSAVCTHMGCVVQWNTAERTWDCPCHGSRFNADGTVKAGPAEKPLSPA